MDSIAMVIIGMLNDTTILAATGIGYIILLIFALSTSMGLNTALETLVAQAYGADQLDLCGKYLNKQRFILVLWFMPLLFFLSYSESMLLWLGQDPEVSRLASKFII